MIRHPVSLRPSPQRIAAAIAVLLALGVGSRAAAQTPSLDAYYFRLDPKDIFKYKWKGDEKVCNVGAFRWLVPPSEFGTGGLDRNFTGYCAEIDVTITAGITYRFRAMSLNDPSVYRLPETPEGIRSAERRATLIRELYGRYYTENKTARPEETYAFQVALWELTHEQEPMDRAAMFDLWQGDFQVNYPRDEAPAFVLLAQDWLNSLTGDDSVYYQNQNLDGRELVRLEGIPNAEGIVAQAQYALRYISGGAPGVGPFAGVIGGGPGGGLLLGFGGGGSVTGLVGPSGGGGPGGGPLVGDVGGPSGTGTTGTTGITGTSTSGRQPPTPPPISTVPAPTGLVLAVLAVGTLASRRLYLRLLHR